MLDLIEHSNLEIIFLMGMSCSIGLLFGVLLFALPLQAKIDTLQRRLRYSRY